MKLLTHETHWQGAETVVALGMFDGVHIGHAQLIRAANHLAALHDLQSVIQTFSNHPLSIIAPERVPPMLTTRAEKIATISGYRPDALIMRPFDATFAALSPEAFVQALAETLHPRHIVVGFNYTFGLKGAGTPQLLAELGRRYGFETHVVGAVVREGETVSSTRIRELLHKGRMGEATALLGRPYSLCGEVVRGKQLGRKLGFPTANLAWPQNKAIPPKGVYFSRVWMEGDAYEAVLNIGTHPTAPGGPPSIEAYLIDFDGDLYGKHLRVELWRYRRPEQRFASLDALKAQMALDLEATVQFFEERKKPQNK